ncbi:hypothetical protein N0V94_008231 [Neodidymelliopsis sp. IMI 364377]|nr:hypothetical protein N0V94_008231 [Neodidymelliopsis sp. IMI 364377]
MNGTGTASAKQMRSRNASKTPVTSKPPAKTVTVSAAAVFRKNLSTPQVATGSRSLETTLKKPNKKKQQVEMHPLALAFKETSEEYRRHLYSTTVSKIDGDLEILLNRLYESNLQVDSSGLTASGSPNSPLKLTVPVKYQRIIQQLYSPLSRYRYGIQRKNAYGEREGAQTTLHDRFQAFEGHVREQMQQIKNLQRQWEGIVAEIFQLGITCLGENDMAVLLSTARGDIDALSPTSKAELMSFVPEHGSPAREAKSKRKRVSFAGPDMKSLFPEFLFHTSDSQKEPIYAVPEVPRDEIRQLDKEVSGLGKQHVVEVQRLEKEYEDWWTRKQTQLARTMLQD